MSIKRTIVAVVVSAVAPLASATTLTFDSLGYINPFTSYTEAGYTLTLITPNPTEYSPHIGDGYFVANTFNWHDEGDNGVGAYVQLTKAGGGAFNLSTFDFYTDASLTVSATGNASKILTGTGTNVVNYSGVTFVDFRSSSFTYNAIDNVNLTAAVPEPEGYAMMLAGLGVLGFIGKRRRKSI
jgi:hypothetical protein